MTASLCSLVSFVQKTLVLIGVCSVFALLYSGNVDAAVLSEDKIIDQTNHYRTQNGLSELVANETLAQAAAAKAAHMIDNDYWSHDAPDGTSPWSFIHSTGYTYIEAGENLAKGYTTDAAVAEAWMNSPSHRENMLHSKFTQVGVAVMPGVLVGKSTILVVAMYAQPTVEETARYIEPLEEVTLPRVQPATLPKMRLLDNSRLLSLFRLLS